jgi:Flp pilus assembly protein protease CpaA
MLFGIALWDLRFHRITNVSLIILVTSIFVTGNSHFNLMYACAVLGVGVACYLYLGLGAGDVKLSFLLALLLVPSTKIAAYWAMCALLALFSILLHFLINRRMKGNIALAPALCGAVLFLS